MSNKMPGCHLTKFRLKKSFETHSSVAVLYRNEVSVHSFISFIPSCKYDDNNQVEFSHKPNHRNGNGISSRAFLLADMKAVRFLTSCSIFNDVIASRYDMKTSCKYTNDNNLEPGNRNIYRNTCASSLLNIDKLIYKKWIPRYDVTSWRNCIMQTQKR